MWLVVKNSILTRDNLLHRGSKGPKKCVFCGLDESIDHLFLQCCVARFVWRVMWCTFNISQIPTSMQQMCDWIYSFNSKNMKLPAISIAALCWKILKTGKLACFRSKYPSDPTNLVLPWIAYWAGMQRTDVNGKLDIGAKMLQLVVKETLHRRHGCDLNNL